MLKHSLLLLLALLIVTPAALATSFIVPTDDEMVAKANAIVIGTVEGHWVDTSREIETVYELRVERAIKGAVRPQMLLHVVSPGGELKDSGVIVPGSAHFATGERVLLFLTFDDMRWTPTDMTLGKFKFTTSTGGERVLVRDSEDIVGWDHSGATHVERVRREAGFLRFVEERVAGRRGTADYFVAPSGITLSTGAPQEDAIGAIPNAPAFPPFTYTDNVPASTGSTTIYGTRWENISAGVTFYKRSETNIAGAADGGASVIQNALAAWNNEPNSNINLIYGGQRANTPALNQDGISVVEFNDPQNRLPGSWTGSGLIGRTYLSYWNPHEFPAGKTWWSIRDADIVFQDGYAATNASFPTAMTHEVGHGIGWRHSDAHYYRPTGNDEPCQAGVEECTTTAIMNSSSISSLGYTLQTWDQNAAQAVYPGSGAPTCTAPAITTQPASRTSTPGASVTLTVAASGTAPLSYQWYIGASGNTASPIGGATGASVTVNPTSTTSYWVRVTNACGSANSAAATITVSGGTGVRQQTPADFNGNGASEFVIYRGGAWLNYSGVASVWTGEGSPNCIPAPADYDGNGITEYSLFCDGGWHFYNADGSYRKGIWTGGVPGDLPVPADYDGDGDDDPTIFRNGNWIRFDFNTGATVSVISTGINGVPVPMDWDGDRAVEPSVYSAGAWHFFNENGSYVKGIWIGNTAGNIPVPGDYDGNGIEEVVIFNNGAWHFFDFGTGAYIRGVLTPYGGQAGAQPAPLDYDGDGSVDFTVLVAGAWHTWNDNGSYRGGTWIGDTPDLQPISRRQHVNP